MYTFSPARACTITTTVRIRRYDIFFTPLPPDLGIVRICRRLSNIIYFIRVDRAQSADVKRRICACDTCLCARITLHRKYLSISKLPRVTACVDVDEIRNVTEYFGPTTSG